MGVGTVLHALFGRDAFGDVTKAEKAEAHKRLHESLYSTGALYTSMMAGTAMAHRVEWWPFGTVIRRARLYPYPIKAMYIGDGYAIMIDDHHDVISVNPRTWVSVPETTP